jgi:hypothetical protein
MALKHFIYDLGQLTPGEIFDARKNINVFLQISEPQYSVGRFQRDSSFVANVTTFDEGGEEMKNFFDGMISCIENGQTVFLNLNDPYLVCDNQYHNAFFENCWNHLENCAKSLFPDAMYFCVLGNKAFCKNWKQFCSKLGYEADFEVEFLSKPALPFKEITLPKPYLAETSPGFASSN